MRSDLISAKTGNRRPLSIPPELKEIFGPRDQAVQDSTDYPRIVAAGSNIFIQSERLKGSPHDLSFKTPKLGGFVCTANAVEQDENLLHYLSYYMRGSEQSWDMFTSRLMSEPFGCGILVGGWSSKRERPETEFERGERYYKNHEMELEREYPGEFVAIWMDQVISHGRSFSQVAKRAYSQVGYHDMYIPKVGEAEREIRITTRRLVR